MQAVIIAALVIGIPLAIYCVCTVKREEIFEEGPGKNAETLNDDGKITKETTMGHIIKMDKGMGEFLMSNGLHCVTCTSSANESLADACIVHGLDADIMLSKIQKYLDENA